MLGFRVRVMVLVRVGDRVKVQNQVWVQGYGQGKAVDWDVRVGNWVIFSVYKIPHLDRSKSVYVFQGQVYGLGVEFVCVRLCQS